MTISVSKKLEGFLLDLLEGLQPVRIGRNLVARPFQGAGQEPAHILVIFGKNYLRHVPAPFSIDIPAKRITGYYITHGKYPVKSSGSNTNAIKSFLRPLQPYDPHACLSLDIT